VRKSGSRAEVTKRSDLHWGRGNFQGERLRSGSGGAKGRIFNGSLGMRKRRYYLEVLSIPQPRCGWGFSLVDKKECRKKEIRRSCARGSGTDPEMLGLWNWVRAELARGRTPRPPKLGPRKNVAPGQGRAFVEMSGGQGRLFWGPKKANHRGKASFGGEKKGGLIRKQPQQESRNFWAKKGKKMVAGL